MNQSPDPTPLPPQPACVPTSLGLRLYAPAKLNLDLLVGPRREDGFHDLDSLVTQVTLYDQIDLAGRPDAQITFACQGADCGSDDNNLALRAAKLLAGQAGVREGADIRLTKRIPPGKGLGGGSSDAAAVLAGLNKLWRTNLPTAVLMELGAQLGSDVPLFLASPASHMTGRGELLEHIEVHPLLAILILPACSTSTPAVYREFDQLSPSKTIIHRTLEAHALRQGPPSHWRHRLVNDLFEPALRVCPELHDLHANLQQAAGIPVCLTGSGSAMFILCDNANEAARVLSKIPTGLAELVVVQKI